MRKIIFMLAALMLLAVLPAAAQDDEATITLERTACFGTCPIYSVTLHEDGSVVYDGEEYVDVEGEQTLNIGEEAFDELMQVIEDAGYFEWDDQYIDITMTDNPYVMTSITRDGETKSINHYKGDESAPLALSYVEYWIDIAAYTQQWTGQKPNLPFLAHSVPPVVTLERTACFGTCPVYQVVIYEDGTVVFLGYRFVEEIGIHIATIDAEDVAALTEAITDAGYFEFEDEYLDQSVSDLPTVMISVLGEEGYKDVIHYLGDDTAPEALTLLEDKIESAVDVSQWIMGDESPEETPTPTA